MSSVSSLPRAVLVVDDEPVVHTIFKKLLTDRGMMVRSVDTGEGAVDLLRREGFGCVLTDKNLPGMDGVQVMRTARKEQPHCACILMTAYASTQSAIEALRLGATDYIEKPFPDLELVVEKVERAIKAQQLDLDRTLLLEQLKTYRAELDQSGAQLRKQKTEIELFDEILEARVRTATADLREKARLLESVLSTSRDSDYAVKLHAESILEGARALSFPGPDEASARARAALARLVRQLESHVGLLEHLKREPVTPPGGG